MTISRITLVVPVLLLSACAFAQVTGSGVSREEAREVPDFDGVRVSHGLKATVTVGPKAVRLSGDEKLLPLVRAEVEDGKLVVRVEKNTRLRGSELRVSISSPQVTSVAASGGARVEAQATEAGTFRASASGGSAVAVSGVNARKAEVAVSGGARVSLQGRADTLEVEASGGAHVGAGELRLQALEVSASGGARVEANPSERIAARLSGGSTVHVDSAPAQRAISASGGARVLFPGK